MRIIAGLFALFLTFLLVYYFYPNKSEQNQKPILANTNNTKLKIKNSNNEKASPHKNMPEISKTSSAKIQNPLHTETSTEADAFEKKSLVTKDVMKEINLTYSQKMTEFLVNELNISSDSAKDIIAIDLHYKTVRDKIQLKALKQSGEPDTVAIAEWLDQFRTALGDYLYKDEFDTFFMKRNQILSEILEKHQLANSN